MKSVLMFRVIFFRVTFRPTPQINISRLLVQDAIAQLVQTVNPFAAVYGPEQVQFRVLKGTKRAAFGQGKGGVRHSIQCK